jgi:DNA-binding transcriptional regulator YhcF (GntR family)
MSLRASTAVWESDIRPTSLKLTALAMADWCNDAGESLFPSMKSIARRLCVSRSQAQRNVHMLIKQGLLSVVAPAKRVQSSTPRYKLHLDRLPQNAPSLDAQSQPSLSVRAPPAAHTCDRNVAQTLDLGRISATRTITRNRHSSTRENMIADSAPDLLRAFPEILQDVDSQVLADWIEQRKRKRAAITKTVLQGIDREAKAAGMNISEALTMCCERGWTGFKADWLRDQKPRSSARSPFHNLDYKAGVDE